MKIKGRPWNNLGIAMELVTGEPVKLAGAVRELTLQCDMQTGVITMTCACRAVMRMQDTEMATRPGGSKATDFVNGHADGTRCEAPS